MVTGVPQLKELELLYAMPEVWSAHVKLDGLTYRSLVPRLPASRRLELLELEEDGYVPHAHEQLAAAYRQVGDDAGVRAVQLAKHRDAAGASQRERGPPARAAMD